MAIICPTHRLLFIQAPRTGCTAIEALLLSRFGGQSLPPTDLLDADGFVRVQRKHCSVQQLLQEGLIPHDYAARYTTVTTIRNPFDSLVSLYVKKREKYQERLSDPASWVHKVRGYVDDMNFCRTHSFDQWLLKRYGAGRMDRLLGRGRRSLYGRYTDGVGVAMRFERLQHDFSSVMHGLGITEDVTIPNVNATPQRTASYQDYYTPEGRELVEYVFRGELDRYGYTFDGLEERAVRPELFGTPR